jgi:hypothetical protein
MLLSYTVVVNSIIQHFWMILLQQKSLSYQFAGFFSCKIGWSMRSLLYSKANVDFLLFWHITANKQLISEMINHLVQRLCCFLFKTTNAMIINHHNYWPAQFLWHLSWIYLCCDTLRALEFSAETEFLTCLISYFWEVEYLLSSASIFLLAIPEAFITSKIHLSALGQVL